LAQHADDEHRLGVELAGAAVQAGDRLAAEQHAGAAEQQRVDEGAEHLGAHQPEGAAAAGRTPRELGDDQRQRQRRDVADHVGGVGEQRQRAAPEADGRLDQEEYAVEHQRPAQGVTDAGAG
jgi:hypothetical protein